MERRAAFLSGAQTTHVPVTQAAVTAARLPRPPAPCSPAHLQHPAVPQPCYPGCHGRASRRGLSPTGQLRNAERLRAPHSGGVFGEGRVGGHRQWCRRCNCVIAAIQEVTAWSTLGSRPRGRPESRPVPATPGRTGQTGQAAGRPPSRLGQMEQTADRSTGGRRQKAHRVTDGGSRQPSGRPGSLTQAGCRDGRLCVPPSHCRQGTLQWRDQSLPLWPAVGNHIHCPALWHSFYGMES